MKPLRKIASELLGFDRRERRGTYILAVIIVILLLLRIVIPGKNSGYDKIVVTSSAYFSPKAEKSRKAPELFLFDPNTASEDTLMLLGLSGRQAATLINYRNSGARFRKPADIYRVYGIDSALAAALVQWIDIMPEGGRVAVEINEPEAGESSSGDDKVRYETGIKSSEAGFRRPGKPAVVIDLNRCAAAELEQLPGIGEVLAARIIRYRDLLGGYVSVSQLSEVYGLDSSVVALVSGSLKISEADIRPIHIDTCSWSRMARHPYLGPEMARAIMKYRSLMGIPFTVDDLVRQRVISEAQAERIVPYISMSGTGSDN